jgi:hypothetical protein
MHFPAVQFIPPTTVGSGDFHLGLALEYYTPGPETGLDVFGWVHLKPVDGLLTMIENVISYDSPGIIVGTMEIVPEPNVGGLLVPTAATGLAMRRGRTERSARKKGVARLAARDAPKPFG